MIKILICDDEAIIRQGIRKILENFYGDIEVRECGDGMEGYKTMAVWNPDAVITDIRMPVLDGLAMIEKALAAGITTQYVVISGDEGREGNSAGGERKHRQGGPVHRK